MDIACISDAGYFHSPKFVSLSVHIITAISTPIHCMGLYCILFKTPEEMKSVRQCLLVLHTWITIFDYSFGVLTIPYVLIPSISGFPLGILKNYGVSTAFQTFMVLNIFAYMCVSIISVFENRFYTVCKFSGMKHWKYWRRYWLVAHYVVVFIGLSHVAQLFPEQTKDVIQRVFLQLPCLPKPIYDSPIFVLVEHNYWFHIIGVFAFMTLITTEIAFFIGFMVGSLQGQFTTRTMSRKTFRMQRKFFTALAIQMMLPMMIFIVPITYIFVAVLINYYNQVLVNMIFINASAHGLVSTSVMIIVHRPYRETIFSLFRFS